MKTSALQLAPLRRASIRNSSAYRAAWVCWLVLRLVIVRIKVIVETDAPSSGLLLALVSALLQNYSELGRLGCFRGRGMRMHQRRNAKDKAQPLPISEALHDRGYA